MLLVTVVRSVKYYSQPLHSVSYPDSLTTINVQSEPHDKMLTEVNFCDSLLYRDTRIIVRLHRHSTYWLLLIHHIIDPMTRLSTSGIPVCAANPLPIQEVHLCTDI